MKKVATGQGKMKRKGEQSNLRSKKLKENIQSSPGPTKILWSTSSEVYCCSKMIDDINKLLNKIQSLENGMLSSDINEDVKNVILVYKASIRDIMKGLDSYLASQKLPLDNSSVNIADVYCYKCPSKRMSKDNIIILCDGGCERGFHQSCMEKSLGNSPRYKYHKTVFSTADSWEKVFPEVSDDDGNKTNVEKAPPALVESQNIVGETKLSDDEELQSKEGEKIELDSSQKNNAGGGLKEYVPSAEVRDFEFKGENLGLPIDVRRKYHELCCILKMTPHEKVIEKCNRDLVCAMVVHITEIVEQIKSSCLSIASIDDLQSCKKLLSSSAIVGMDVEFLLTKIDNLIIYLREYQANRDKEKEMKSELVGVRRSQKEEEIIDIERSIYNLGDKYGDILPNDATLNSEFSKEAKNGLGP